MERGRQEGMERGRGSLSAGQYASGALPPRSRTCGGGAPRRALTANIRARAQISVGDGWAPYIVRPLAGNAGPAAVACQDGGDDGGGAAEGGAGIPAMNRGVALFFVAFFFASGICLLGVRDAGARALVCAAAWPQFPLSHPHAILTRVGGDEGGSTRLSFAPRLHGQTTERPPADARERSRARVGGARNPARRVHAGGAGGAAGALSPPRSLAPRCSRGGGAARVRFDL